MPKRESLIAGQKNVTNTPLMDPEKVYLPPLHIKLGRIKTVVEAMDENGAGFMYLKNKFPRISDVKNQRRFICWTSNKRVNTGRKI